MTRTRSLVAPLVLAVLAGCAGNAGNAARAGDAGNSAAGPAARAAATASEEFALFPICVGARFGLVDRSGKVVVPPRLLWIDENLRPLIKVVVEDASSSEKGEPGQPSAHAGFVDGKGRFAIPPIYDDAHPFSEGLAAVQRDGAWGFVDGQGKVRIPLRFEQAQSFSEGLAFVADDAGQKFVDPEGRTVIDVSRLRWRRGDREYPLVAGDPFTDGLAAFRVILHGENPDTPVGFMDRTGKIIIPPTFSYAYAFHGGNAKVQVLCGGGVGGRCEGIVRRDGSWAVPPTYEFLAGGDDDLVAFRSVVGKAHLQGFLNLRNEVVIPPRFEHACLWFRDGRCQTMNAKRWAYVDRTGAEVLVLPPETEHADEFVDGIAMIRTRTGARYIRRDGSPAFPGVFKDAARFRRGLAYVQFREGGEGYVDPQGRVVYRQTEPCKPW